MFKKLAFPLIVMLLLFSACSNEENKKENEQNQQNTEESESEKDDSVTSEENNTEEDSEEITKKNDETADENKDKQGGDDSEQTEGFLQYRPKTGELREFAEKGAVLFTEKVIDQNEQYLQMKITLGSSETTEVYLWTKDKIALVYQSTSSDDHNNSILNQFEAEAEPEVLMGTNAAWELKLRDHSIRIGEQVYEKVYVIKQVSEEVVGSETIKTRYYAPNHGMVREEVEVTGEGGYKSTVDLMK